MFLFCFFFFYLTKHPIKSAEKFIVTALNFQIDIGLFGILIMNLKISSTSLIYMFCYFNKEILQFFMRTITNFAYFIALLALHKIIRIFIYVLYKQN